MAARSDLKLVSSFWYADVERKENTTMKNALSFLMLAIMIFVRATPAGAGNRSGTVSEQFLKIGTSARAIAMGGAQVAIAEGASSLAYNAAGILAVNDYGFAATY